MTFETDRSRSPILQNTKHRRTAEPKSFGDRLRLQPLPSQLNHIVILALGRRNPCLPSALALATPSLMLVLVSDEPSMGDSSAECSNPHSHGHGHRESVHAIRCDGRPASDPDAYHVPESDHRDGGEQSVARWRSSH